MQIALAKLTLYICKNMQILKMGLQSIDINMQNYKCFLRCIKVTHFIMSVIFTINIIC